MTNIRRYYQEGQIYFLTHVTYQRKPILVSNADLVWQAFNYVCDSGKIDLIAWAILPDHLHMLVKPNNQDLSKLIKRFKLKFSALYRSANGIKSGRLWQFRFWDHIIRDESDLNMHLDYIHYNSVKHGLSLNPHEYEHSSFRKFVEMGCYDINWASEININNENNFGE